MDRTQFTFYESFAQSIRRIKNKAARADAYDAICNYALYGLEPDLDKLPDAAAIAYIGAKPNLDASRKKAESGKRGGSVKQTESKDEANGKQEETETEKENEKENEIENECYSPLYSPAVQSVFSDYLSRINVSASQASLDELKGFVEVVGPDVCKRAFDIALDSKKTTWPYIRAILRDKAQRGVKCLADWDALEDSPKQKVLYGSAGSAPLGDLEREALARMLGGNDG